MSILDLDVNDNDLLLQVLGKMFNEIKHSYGDNIIFKLDHTHNLSRIKYPNRYLIYYDYVATEFGRLRDGDGNLTVEFRFVHEKSLDRYVYYPLSLHKNYTLEDAYNFDINKKPILI